MAEKRKFEEELESDDPVLSLQDIIDEDAELETTANAVLGGSNDQECTYSEGYLPRQALYACATCEIVEEAGICLACSLDCHEGHELFELYTKRDFRCDCGNSKFPNLTCMLHPQKDEVNQRNAYNHNFKGKYCTCKRPYPDPEDDIEDVMVQCIICEDWFHGRHLHGKGIPGAFDYAEMICHICMKGIARVLWFYNWEFTSHPHEASIVDVESCSSKRESENVESCSTEWELENNQPSASIVDGKSTTEDNSKSSTDDSNSSKETTETLHTAPDDTRKVETSCLKENLGESNKSEDLAGIARQQKVNSVGELKSTSTDCDGNLIAHSVEKCAASVKLSESWKNQCAVFGNSCLLRHLINLYERFDFPDSASFWPDGWRKKLCQCVECNSRMKELSFLFNNTDTVAEYEAKGLKNRPPSSNGVGLLSGMNRIQQVEVIQGYNDMKAELTEYLRSFAQENRIVTEDDIRHFFQRMNEMKRVKVDTGIQNSCR